jgi:hypothetical protein
MCLCIENCWCRDYSPVEILGMKIPASNHAPGCDEYKLEPFVVVEFEGVKCFIDQHEKESFMEDGSDCEYVFHEVELTRDQFERMPEFTGF